MGVGRGVGSSDVGGGGDGRWRQERCSQRLRGGSARAGWQAAEAKWGRMRAGPTQLPAPHLEDDPGLAVDALHPRQRRVVRHVGAAEHCDRAAAGAAAAGAAAAGGGSGGAGAAAGAGVGALVPACWPRVAAELERAAAVGHRLEAVVAVGMAQAVAAQRLAAGGGAWGVGAAGGGAGAAEAVVRLGWEAGAWEWAGGSGPLRTSLVGGGKHERHSAHATRRPCLAPARSAHPDGRWLSGVRELGLGVVQRGRHVLGGRAAVGARGGGWEDSEGGHISLAAQASSSRPPQAGSVARAHTHTRACRRPPHPAPTGWSNVIDSRSSRSMMGSSAELWVSTLTATILPFQRPGSGRGARGRGNGGGEGVQLERYAASTGQDSWGARQVIDMAAPVPSPSPAAPPAAPARAPA
jgi:hypothetical protein